MSAIHVIYLASRNCPIYLATPLREKEVARYGLAHSFLHALRSLVSIRRDSSEIGELALRPHVGSDSHAFPSHLKRQPLNPDSLRANLLLRCLYQESNSVQLLLNFSGYLRMHAKANEQIPHAVPPIARRACHGDDRMTIDALSRLQLEDAHRACACAFAALRPSPGQVLAICSSLLSGSQCASQRWLKRSPRFGSVRRCSIRLNLSTLR